MPDGLDFDEGAACNCGTGTAFHALKRLNIAGDDTLAIFGQGPAEASGTMFAKAMGARMIAVDVEQNGCSWRNGWARMSASMPTRKTRWKPSTS